MPPNRCYWAECCKALEVDIRSTEQPLAGNCLRKQLLVAVEHRMIGTLVVVVVVEHRMVGILVVEVVVEHRKIGILMAVGVEGCTKSTARLYR